MVDGADFTFFAGQRVGVVGRNGCGKSSLFAILNGELDIDAGRLEWPGSWSLGEVAQHAPQSELSALEFVKAGDQRLRDLDAQRYDPDPERAAHAEHDFAEADGYRWESRAGELIDGLGFSAADQQRPVNDFSGGWRMRLALAQTLMRRADLLLLDEPTNHLDLDAILWLGEYLRRFEGVLLVISHDRDFLDQVCTHILHLDGQTATPYTGNFTEFARQRAERAALAASQAVQLARQRAHLQAFIDRFKAKASKARQAQSRVKMLERLGSAPAPRGPDSIDIPMPTPAKLPSQLLKLIDCDVGYVQGQPIVAHMHLVLEPGDRIGVLGRNGAGKSTFMKLLGKALEAQRGERWTAADTRIGYFSQFEVEALPDDRTPLELFLDRAPQAGQQKLRDWLGSFKYSGDMATQPIGPRSGGEKARLVLALLLYDAPNVILLDEPTNHLDLEMREALAESLNDFAGALVLVAHDRNLLESCCDRFLIVRDQRLTPFDGDLDDYTVWLKQQRSQQRRAAAASPATAAPVPSAAARSTAGSDVPASSQQRRNDQKRLQAQLRKTENAMEAASAELQRLEQEHLKMSQQQRIEAHRLQELANAIASARTALARAEVEWLAAAEALQ